MKQARSPEVSLRRDTQWTGDVLLLGTTHNHRAEEVAGGAPVEQGLKSDDHQSPKQQRKIQTSSTLLPSSSSLQIIITIPITNLIFTTTQITSSTLLPSSSSLQSQNLRQSSFDATIPGLAHCNRESCKLQNRTIACCHQTSRLAFHA